MKALSVILGIIVLVAIVLVVAAWPTMIVLGLLHRSGLESIPALGFWQTLGVMYLIAVVGGLFHGSSSGSNQ